MRVQFSYSNVFWMYVRTVFTVLYMQSSYVQCVVCSVRAARYHVKASLICALLFASLPKKFPLVCRLSPLMLMPSRPPRMMSTKLYFLFFITCSKLCSICVFCSQAFNVFFVYFVFCCRSYACFPFLFSESWIVIAIYLWNNDNQSVFVGKCMQTPYDIFEWVPLGIYE